MDPATYRDAMLSGQADGGAESSQDAQAGAAAARWEYIRVSALGFLPGLLCPHHDRVQSNGVLRETDFDGMMKRHPGEQGICIDHFAALVIADSRYEVLSLPGKEGSLMPDGSSRPGEGKPAVWLKSTSTDGGSIESRLLPPTGQLADILRPAREVVEDPRVATARAENPSDDL